MRGIRAKALLVAAAVCIASASTVSFGADLRRADEPHGHSRSRSMAASGRLAVGRAPNSSAATWRMPWQIRPIVSGAGVGRERIVEALVRKTGRVRGTPAAIATIGRSLRPVRGPNRTIKACRAAVSREAAKFGAREVEAVSAGRERRTASRNVVAPVKFRITYRKRGRYEVRLSVLTCVVNRRGKLLDAFIPHAKPRRAG